MHKTKKGAAVFGEIVGLAIGLGVNMYLLPKLPFVTNSYFKWLPIGNAALVLSSVFDIAKFFAPGRYYHLLKAAAILPDMWSAYNMAVIFPFQFALMGYKRLNQLVRLALYLGVFGTAVGFIVNLAKFIAPLCSVRGSTTIKETA